MKLLFLHCRNSEALRCSVLQTGSADSSTVPRYLWKLVNHFICISYQPIRALRPNIGRMHVNVIGILAGSLSPREPARRL